jgi:hypothetical protein
VPLTIHLKQAVLEGNHHEALVQPNSNQHKAGRREQLN